jgi:uncharacterized membrane protein
MGSERQGRVHWGRVARWAGAAGIIAAMIAAGTALAPFAPYVPRSLARRLTEGFLRSLLIGYAAVLIIAPALIVGLGAWVYRGRRRGVRRPWSAKLMLLCGSCLLSLTAAEVAALAWRAWAHRMPALPTRFAETPRDEVSLVVIGGSSAAGFPYEPKFSVGQVVGWTLGRLVSGRKFLVDVRARPGANLEDMHLELARLTRRPDILLIYSGHNEFLSRYEGWRDAGPDEVPHQPLLNLLYRASLHSPLCRLIYETNSRNRLGGPPPRINEHRLIDPPVCTPSEYAEVRDDHRRRLEAILAYCEQIGCLAIVLLPPGNDAGFDPSRTTLPETVSMAERAALVEALTTARATEEADPSQAMDLYRSLLSRQPHLAEAHFRLARLLERSGACREANDHYIAARDLDGFPVRCTSDFEQDMRDVAARHSCLLVDGPAVLRALNPRGLLDDSLMHDSTHATLFSQVALARAIVDALRARRAFGLSADADTAIDPAECGAVFGIDQGMWAYVCKRTGQFYRDFAPARFDPSERLAKQHRNEEAGARILAGLAPERAGIPGIGFHPTPSPGPDWWATPPPHQATAAATP